MSAPALPAPPGPRTIRKGSPPVPVCTCKAEDLPQGWTLERAHAQYASWGAVRPSGLAMTPGVLLAGVVAFLLYQVESLTGNRWLGLGVAAALALPVVAVLLRPRIGSLSVSRELHGSGAVGEQVQTTLVVRNTGSRRTSPAVATDAMPGHAPLVVGVPALAPGQVLRLPAQREVVTSGRTLGGVVRLAACSPVGLLVARSDHVLRTEVIAHAAPLARSTPLAAGVGSEPGSGAGRPARGAGGEVLGLREWRRGDAGRSVSARATARHGRPLVLEHEQEQDPPLVVLVTGGGYGVAWEELISSACALSVDAVRSGRPLILLGPPGPAHPTPAQVQDAFAAADWAPPFDRALTAAAVRATGRRGSAVLVAPAEAVLARLEVRRAFAAAGCRLVVLPTGSDDGE